MKFIVRTLAVAATILIIAYIFPSLLHVDNFTTAVIAALLLAIVNAFIRPVALILSLPIQVLTIGLFTFVINALMLWLVSLLLSPSFQVDGFFEAIIASILISVVSTFFSSRVIEEE